MKKLFAILPLILSIIIFSCDKEESITQPAATASIFVTSIPSGASITFDNVVTGKVTPDTIKGISEGVHTVKLTLQNYADTVVTVTLIKDQVLTVSSALRVILSPYAGVWKGTTSQNLPVYFHITTSGIIDSISMGFRVSMAGSSCTYTTTTDSLLMISGNSFSIPISGGMAYTTLRGTFSSASVVTGTTDDFSVNGLYCTGVFVIGTSVSQGSKTWQATKQ